jgi:hypothetical protein
MTPKSAGSSGSPILVVVLLVALAVGASASLVAGAASTSPPAPGPTPLYQVTPSTVSAIFFVILAVVVGLYIYVRINSDRGPIPGRMVVTALTAILIAVLFLALFHVLSGGNPAASGSGGGSGNSTSAGTQPSNSTGNLTGPGGQVVFLSLHLPSWSLFAVVGVVLVVVAVFLIPVLLATAERRHRLRELDGMARPQELREALSSAAGELARGLEPREVVIRLYTTLLVRVGTIVGGVDEVTPEEIRSLHLERLGIRPTSARTLTRLFEEARYSTHPMGPEAAERAERAIAQALDDLDRHTDSTA